MLLDLFTGGAHCCFATILYRFTGAIRPLGAKEPLGALAAWVADQYLLGNARLDAALAAAVGSPRRAESRSALQERLALRH